MAVPADRPHNDGHRGSGGSLGRPQIQGHVRQAGQSLLQTMAAEGAGQRGRQAHETVLRNHDEVSLQPTKAQLLLISKLPVESLVNL